MVEVTKVLVVLVIWAVAVCADEVSHKYKDGDEVILWVNKVGPYHNPQETYQYYSLPFCRPPSQVEVRHKKDGLGAALEGNDLDDSGLKIRFKEDITQAVVCDLALDDDTIEQFTYAVKNHYWYQMYIDDLPIWGMVGEMLVPEMSGAVLLPAVSEQPFLYTHRTFSISYNNENIIEVNLTAENPQPITPGTIRFSYSVYWHPTTLSFIERFDRYLDFDFFEHQIHWFSIFNSFMMVVFLCGVVVLILMRTLKNDYMRYSMDEDDMELDRVIDESGWKQVHGDVFRPPPFLMMYSSLLGVGIQFLVLMAICIVLSLVGELYTGRGFIVSTFLVVYALSSFVAGYASGSYYKRNNGTKWKQTMFVTALLFPAVSCGIALLLNFIAIGYQSLAVVTFGTMVSIAAMWCFIALPLLILGTVVGRNTTQTGDFPCHVNNLRRPIPMGNWYTNPILLSAIGGLLPFASIFIETYFVFTSFWNYKFYYVYGFMLLVFIILNIVIMCITVVATYVLLSAENYRWQWTAFFSGGSTAFYVFLYAVYFFFAKTHMHGFFQTCFYFGYTAGFCYVLFLMCGAIGYLGANSFVYRIYQAIKSE